MPSKTQQKLTSGKKPQSPMDFDTMWRQRFGDGPPDEAKDVALFLKHASVRLFSDQSVPESLIQGLIGCAQSAATSSHLQLWSVISVHDREKRLQIEHLAADYRHIGSAPWFFVFLADVHRLRRACGDRPDDALDYVEYFTMAVVDASLAAERMVCAAESVGLGICYIGAVRNDVRQMAEILDLPEGAFPVFGLCIGWPTEGSEPEIKPRFKQPDIWFRDAYDREAGFEEFDQRMRSYYAEKNQNPNVTWSQRSCRRTDEAHLTGRESLLAWLHEQGLATR